MCFSPQGRAIFGIVTWKSARRILATGACNFSTSQLQKVVRSWHVLYIFTWKCFFNISTSKSGPNLTCFVHFHLKMCFSPQRRAIFQHLNFKKWSGADVFCTFSLQNVLLATAACNFWFLLWPHDSAPAALTSLLFDSPDTRIIGKTQHFATSLTFGAGESSFFWLSRYCIFFLLTLLHLICFSSAFQLSILSEVYYLNFLRWYNQGLEGRGTCHRRWFTRFLCRWVLLGLDLRQHHKVRKLSLEMRRWKWFITRFLNKALIGWFIDFTTNLFLDWKKYNHYDIVIMECNKSVGATAGIWFHTWICTSLYSRDSLEVISWHGIQQFFVAHVDLWIQMNEQPGRLNVGKGGSCFITVTLLLCMYHHLPIIHTYTVYNHIIPHIHI